MISGFSSTRGCKRSPLWKAQLSWRSRQTALVHHELTARQCGPEPDSQPRLTQSPVWAES